MLEVVGRDYVRTAESKGLGPSRIVGIHMLRNALIPVVTILGPILATLITGSIVVETVFQIPGIGALYIGAIHQHDYGVIMTMTLIYAAAVALINVVVDLSYGILDPRVRP
jgi:ABC-type dipeptide/oligopeptide/nickel transport system permease component